MTSRRFNITFIRDALNRAIEALRSSHSDEEDFEAAAELLEEAKHSLDELEGDT